MKTGKYNEKRVSKIVSRVYVKEGIMEQEKRSFTCIVCPNGCEVTAYFQKDTGGKVQLYFVEGNQCRKGEDYVTQELVDPRRTIASSVLVEGGELPLASVRLSDAIPRGLIPKAMAEIRRMRLKAPVKAGTVLEEHFLGYDSKLIVTKTVESVIS